MLDPAVGALLAGAFALLFVSAAFHKFTDPAVFGQVLRAYRLVPEPLAAFSLSVPLLEVAIGVSLLVSAMRASVAAAGALLLTFYALAIAINLARGRRHVSCGCGGPNDRRPIALWMVFRNLALAALLALVRLPWSARPTGWADALTIGAGTVVAALLYLSLDTLLGRIAVLRAASGVRP
jgi:methylamine utilization protein MauE